MRKQKKSGSCSNCGTCVTKKVGHSQLEWWMSKVGGACQGLMVLYKLYCLYEVMKPLLEQQLLSG